MVNHTYVVEFVYTNEKTSGHNYQVVKSKNKKQAVEKAISNIDKECKCVLISIKKISKKLISVVQNHNEKVESENE